MAVAQSRASDDFGKLVLRLGLATVVLFHGIFKVTHGIEWIKGPLADMRLPAFLAYGTYAAEVAAPVLLILGLWTRAAAAIIAIDMIMALALVLRPQLMVVREQGGGWAVELEVLILVAAIALAAMGGGRYALTSSRPTRSTRL
jgi:putative oxidoreductase